MSIFAGKTLMITGGTGSFGNAVLNRFLKTDIAEIRIFSRDEKKQDDMRHEYQVKYPEYANKIKFFIGDVRNLQSCRNAMPGVDYTNVRLNNLHYLSANAVSIVWYRDTIIAVLVHLYREIYTLEKSLSVDTREDEAAFVEGFRTLC